MDTGGLWINRINSIQGFHRIVTCILQVVGMFRLSSRTLNHEFQILWSEWDTKQWLKEKSASKQEADLFFFFYFQQTTFLNTEEDKIIIILIKRKDTRPAFTCITRSNSATSIVDDFFPFAFLTATYMYEN